MPKKATAKKEPAKQTSKKLVQKKAVEILPKRDTRIGRFLDERLHLFSGNLWIFLALVIFGIFVPPLLAAAIIYFAHKSTDKRPRLFDRYIIVFFVTVFFYQLFARLIEGYGINQIFTRVAATSALATVIFYPFIFFWLWFDHNYFKKKQ